MTFGAPAWLERIRSRARPRKSNFVGAPACFKLELACEHLNKAFPGQCYHVGSSRERADFRDVDVRMILDDADFATLFPNVGSHWEFDPRWLVMTVSISEWLSAQCGMKVDFQFQPRTHANERHSKPRNPIGLDFSKYKG